jgi:hypothetical protein
MRSWNLIGLLLVLVGAGVVVAMPRVAAQDATYVKLVQGDTGKVLAVADASDEAGARAVLAADGDGKALQWQLVKDGDFYKLVNRTSGKVLDVFEESQDEGAPIIQWDDKPDGNDNQRWAWEGDGKERRLKSKSSGLVLDADAEGKIIQRKADGQAKSQLWRVVEVKE